MSGYQQPQAFNPKPLGPNLGQSIVEAGNLVNLQQVHQDMERANKLRGILGAPGAVDPKTGVPTTDTVANVMSVDPAAGMKLQQNTLQLQQSHLQTERYKTDTFANQYKLTAQVSEEAYTAYKQAMANGMDETAARAKAQQVLTEGQKRLAQGGVFSEEQQKTWPRTFDPVVFAGHAQSYNQWQTRQDADRRANITERREQHQDRDRGMFQTMDSDGRIQIHRPNAPVEDRVLYEDGSRVPLNKQGGNKLGTGNATANLKAEDLARIKRMATVNVEKDIKRPLDLTKPEDQNLLDVEVAEIAAHEARAKKGSARDSATIAENEKIEAQIRLENPTFTPGQVTLQRIRLKKEAGFKPEDPSKGWEFQVDTDGTTFQIRKGTGEAKDLQGQPYVPKGPTTKQGGPQRPNAANIQEREALTRVAIDDINKERATAGQPPIDLKIPADQAEVDRRVNAETERRSRDKTASGKTLDDETAIAAEQVEARLKRPLTPADAPAVARQRQFNEDKRKADNAGATAAARVAAGGGNERLGEEKIVREELENLFERPLTPADDPMVAKLVQERMDKRKADIAAATAAARPQTPAAAAEKDAMIRADAEIARRQLATGEPLSENDKAAIREEFRLKPKVAQAGQTAEARQAATAKPVAIEVDGKPQTGIWKNQQWFEPDGVTQIAGNVKLATKAPAIGTTASEKATRFAEMKAAQIANGTYVDDTTIYRALDHQMSEDKQPIISDDAALIAAQVALQTGHPPAWMGRSQGSLTKFLDTFAKEAKRQGLGAADIAANIAKFSGEMAESRALGSLSARVDFAAKELEVALPMAMESSERVWRPGWKKVAEIQQAIKGQASDPDLLEFAQFNQQVLSAYAQAMQRGGVSTVHAMERAEGLLSTATSRAGYIRQLDTLHKEVQSILYGTEAAKAHLRSQIDGKPEETKQPELTGVPRPGARFKGTGGAWKGKEIPDGAVEKLRANPGTASDFDTYFESSGLAKRILDAKAPPGSRAATPSPTKTAAPDLSKMPSATGPKGEIIYDDGEKWINPDGTPYKP